MSRLELLRGWELELDVEVLGCESLGEKRWPGRLPGGRGLGKGVQRLGTPGTAGILI